MKEFPQDMINENKDAAVATDGILLKPQFDVSYYAVGAAIVMRHKHWRPTRNNYELNGLVKKATPLVLTVVYINQEGGESDCEIKIDDVVNKNTEIRRVNRG